MELFIYFLCYENFCKGLSFFNRYVDYLTIIMKQNYFIKKLCFVR
jgi:hypothetical protein